MTIAFDLGERVIVKDDYPYGITHLGKTGKVVDIIGKDYGIRFDEYHYSLHGCSGHCEDGHGWYVPVEYLEQEWKPLLGDDEEDCI